MKKLIILLAVFFVASLFLIPYLEGKVDTLSTLTAAQIEKLYGRKRHFIPTGYRKGIEEKVNRAIRERQGGEISDSQVLMTSQNITAEKPAMRGLLMEGREEARWIARRREEAGWALTRRETVSRLQVARWSARRRAMARARGD